MPRFHWLGRVLSPWNGRRPSPDAGRSFPALINFHRAHEVVYFCHASPKTRTFRSAGEVDKREPCLTRLDETGTDRSADRLAVLRSGSLSVSRGMLRTMNATGLLIGALLLVVGIGIGIALAAGWWRDDARRGNPTLEVAALLAPASDALVRVEQRLREVERDRAGAYAGLYEQVAALHRTSADLGSQTRSLVNALRAPQVRGRWGEVQLQRIVELAGMVEHCDFDTQVSAAVADAAGVRPDMIVRLAGGRHIPVDAKVPFDAWLQSREGADENRRVQLMTMHARAMRAHVDALASKAYWQHF